MKILKKSKGKWIAVSLATTAMLMISGGLVTDVSAQEGEAVQSAEAGMMLEDANVLEEQANTNIEAGTLLEEEQVSAVQQIEAAWEINTLSEVKAEIERQEQLALPRYVIQWGDTLSQLAAASQTTVADLALLNRIENPDLIYVGNTLEGVLRVAPTNPIVSTSDNTFWTAKTVTEIHTEIQRQASLDKEDYQIQWGDTLSGISHVTGITVEDLVAQNQIVNPDLIYTGNFLKGLLKPFKLDTPKVIPQPPVTKVAPITLQPNVDTVPTPLPKEKVPVPTLPNQDSTPLEPGLDVTPQPIPPIITQPDAPKETQPEVTPPMPDTPTEPKETPETDGATPPQPDAPKETQPEVAPPMPDTPAEPKEVEPPQEQPQLTRPQLVVAQQILNPLQKNALLQYTLTDPDQLFVSGVARLMLGEQMVQEVALSPERQAIFTGLVYEVPYRVETTFTYRMNGEELSEQVATTSQDSFTLALKKIEWKHIESMTIQPIDSTTTASLADGSFNGQSHIVKVKLAGLQAIYVPITSVEVVTVDQQAAYRVTMTLPELVQYHDNTHHYSNQYVGLFNTAGTLWTTPDVTIDYSTVHGYDASRQVAYRNIEKLLPYYNRELIVQYGNRMDPTFELATKVVKSVLPMTDTTLSVALRPDKQAINQLLVHYEDGTVATLPLMFSQDFAEGLIAEYTIAGTDLIYTPTQWQTDYTAVIADVTEVLRNISYYSTSIWRALGEKGRPNHANMDQLYLKESFQYVQAQLPNILEKVLSNSGLRLSTAGLSEQILQHKEQLLLGLAYVNKWYDVNFGALNLKDILLYRQDYFGRPVNQLDWLIGVGSRTYEGLRPNETPQVYAQILAAQTGKESIPAFLSSLRAQFVPQMSDNEWFKQATQAFIADVPSQTANVQVNVYEKLSRDHLVNTLLPLLSLSEESLYIIPTMATVSFGDFATYVDSRLKHSNPTAYQQAIADFKKIILMEAENQTAHFDMWQRIALPTVKDKLTTYAIPVWDTFRQHATNMWSARQGDDTTTAVREFFGPTGHWHGPSSAGAFSNGETIWFITDRLLRQSGAAGGSVFTHEVVHVLEDDVYLGGHGRREGIGKESYAEGLLQSVRDRTRLAMSMNFYTKMTDAQHRDLPYANKSPERFQTAADLQQYMHGLLDVMYVLDYAEAMAIAKMPQSLQRYMLQKMTGLKDRETDHHTDFIQEFSEAEWNAIAFQTIDDFVEHQAVVTRHHYRGSVITGGQHAGRNTYTGIPLFSPMYGLLQNDNGASGGYTFRRTAFELLAHKGYEAGFIPYVSDQLANQARAKGQALSDTYIVQQILGDEFANLTEFKKAMFRERISQLANLTSITITTAQNKPVHLANFSTLQDLMDTAVRQDAMEMQRTGSEPSGAVHRLKTKVLAEYLRITDEFRTSIFGEDGQ